MKKKLGSIFLSMFLLTACNTVDGDSISDINLEGEGYHLLFFSDEEKIKLENNYYDVLLDLRKEFPNEMADVILVQSTNKNEKLKKFDVSVYPTLIVIKDGEVLTRIEGKQSKREIMNHLKKAMEDQKKR
ncbi:thioredoxin domain-containing protein [Calidifontibacillus oryziterrae]|uniref:thioredoxin domain-containing protein n=1 Tax=Calidifontibacillus oryziterrae TaxID=1191699 RepID=UPI00030EAD02|nr:thioredoxin domain-containing protein [Calidifontibacillus oryziterrae]